jgi:hypothetical protein
MVMPKNSEMRGLPTRKLSQFGFVVEHDARHRMRRRSPDLPFRQRRPEPVSCSLAVFPRRDRWHGPGRGWRAPSPYACLTSDFGLIEQPAPACPASASATEKRFRLQSSAETAAPSRLLLHLRDSTAAPAERARHSECNVRGDERAVCSPRVGQRRVQVNRS